MKSSEHLLGLMVRLLFPLALLGSLPAAAAPITFASFSDGYWRGDPPPLPWEIVEGGNDHVFPVPGDTAGILGHNIWLGGDEAVAVLNLDDGALYLGGYQLSMTGGGSWSRGSIFSGVVDNQGGSFTLAPAASLTLSAILRNESRLIQTGSNLVLYAGAELDNVANGTWELQADANIASACSCSTPPINNAGLLMKTGGGISALGSGSLFNNAGTVEVWSGTLQIRAMVSQFVSGVLGGGTWKVFTNATLDLGVDTLTTNAGTIVLDGADASFPNLVGLGFAENQGHLSLLNGASLYALSPVVNSGSLSIGAGCIMSLPGDLTQAASGRLSGSGTINGQVVNGGEIEPGDSIGTLSVSGNFRQTAGGRLNISIGGTSSGQYDRLSVGQAAELSGLLRVTFINGFVPSPGDQFLIMEYAYHAGTFATVQAVNLGPDLMLNASYENPYGGLMLTVIPSRIAFYSLERTATTFSLSFTAYAGVNYFAEYTDSLSPANWQFLGLIAGDGTMQTVVDYFPPEPRRFYRVTPQ